MRRHELSDEEWRGLRRILPSGAGRPPKGSTRRFLNAVLWKVKTGAPWRDLPGWYGNWKTVYSRFRRWALAGHFQTLFEALQIDVDDNWNAIDSSYVRVHQHGTGGKGGLKITQSAAPVAETRRRSMCALMPVVNLGRSL